MPDSLRSVLPGKDDEGIVVVAAVAPTAEEGDWSALTSARLAGACAKHRRTLLVDLGLEHPSVHHALGEIAGEGISDVFQYSASMQRVTRSVQEGAFLFAPAGTVAGDPGAILADPRWEGLLARYAGAGGAVVLHLPLSAEGADAILDRADHVVLLGSPEDAPASLLGGSRESAAWLGPRSGRGAAAEDTVGAVPQAEAELDVASLEVLLSEELGEEDSASEVATPADAGGLGERDGEFQQPSDSDPFWDDVGTVLGSEVGSPAASHSEGADLHFTDLPGTDPVPAGRRPGAGMMVILASVGVAVVVVVLTLLRGGDSSVDATLDTDESVTVSASRTATPPAGSDAEDSPGSDAESAGSGEAVGGGETGAPASDGAAVAPATEAASPTPAMAFVLTVNAHERMQAAQSQAESIRERFPDLQVILVPIEVRGSLFYRVVVGPAQTQAEAEEIRSSMRGFLGEAVARSAIVRPTRWAFLLGEFADRAEATRRMTDVSGAGIPSYVVEYSADGRELIYRVYSGAFATRTESAALASLIDAAGLGPATLSERMGRPTR